jgi:hypothetical protein
MIIGHARANRVTLLASIPLLALVAFAAGCGTATVPSAAGGTAPSSGATSPGSSGSAGSSGSSGPAGGTPTAVPTTTAGPPVVPGQPACSGWPANATHETVPASFAAVAVLRCVAGEQTIPGKGQWQTATLERADQNLAPLVAALRLPPVVRHPGIMCPALAMLPPQIALIGADGKTVVPRFPLGECGLIQPRVLTALAALHWQTVSVRLVTQLQTQAQVASGCAPEYKDPFVLAESSQPSSGGALYAAPPASLRICVYSFDASSSTTDFAAGTTVTGATVTALLTGLSGPRQSATCSLPHASFAVVGGENAGAPVVYVELGGCDRVYRYESQSGGLMGMTTGQASASAVAIIEFVTHPRPSAVAG